MRQLSAVADTGSLNLEHSSVRHCRDIATLPMARCILLIMGELLGKTVRNKPLFVFDYRQLY